MEHGPVRVGRTDGARLIDASCLSMLLAFHLFGEDGLMAKCRLFLCHTTDVCLWRGTICLGFHQVSTRGQNLETRHIAINRGPQKSLFVRTGAGIFVISLQLQSPLISSMKDPP